MRWGAVVAVASLVVSACGSGDEVGIIEVFIGEDDQTVFVRLDAGGTEGEVSVEETADEVRLTGSAPAACGPSDDCRGPEIQVHLDDPLGDRALIDGATDTEVPYIEHCADTPTEVFADICSDLAA
jgi:hypothetical protein